MVVGKLFLLLHHPHTVIAQHSGCEQSCCSRTDDFKLHCLLFPAPPAQSHVRSWEDEPLLPGVHSHPASRVPPAHRDVTSHAQRLPTSCGEPLPPPRQQSLSCGGHPPAPQPRCAASWGMVF